MNTEEKLHFARKALRGLESAASLSISLFSKEEVADLEAEQEAFKAIITKLEAGTSLSPLDLAILYGAQAMDTRQDELAAVLRQHRAILEHILTGEPIEKELIQ